MKEQAEEEQGVVCCDSIIWIQSPRSAHTTLNRDYPFGLRRHVRRLVATTRTENIRELTVLTLLLQKKNNSVPRVRVSMSLLGSKPFYSATNLSCSRAKTGTNVAAVLVLYQKNNSFFLILDKLALDYLQSCLTDGNDEV